MIDLALQTTGRQPVNLGIIVMLNRENIQRTELALITLAARSSMAVVQATHKRVSHTLAAIIRVTLAMYEVHRTVQTDENFRKMVTLALTASRAKGPTVGMFEIESYDQGRELFIQGSFDVEKLRQYLMVVPQPRNTLTLDPSQYNFGKSDAEA